MKRYLLAAGVAAALALGSAPPASAQGSDPIVGVWRNPKNSVHIDIKPCGAMMCGVVVWATPKAQADAREGGTENLIGAQLLRNFERTSKGSWRGKVFVPDIRATFGGTAEVLDANTLRAKGCLLAGLGCKTQLWKRIEG